MPRWLQITLTLSLFASVMLTRTDVGARADDTPLYRCTASDIATMDEGGKLDRLKDGHPFTEALRTFMIDTATGALRMGTTVQQWRVVQRASPANDFVAASGRTDANAVEDFVRVRAWKSGQPVTFFRVGLTMLSTGTCEVVS